MENDVILKKSLFPLINLRSSKKLEILSNVNDFKNNKIEETWLPPPDRSPPKPPSVLILPVVPQLPSPFAFSIEPTRAAFTIEGGISK